MESIHEEQTVDRATSLTSALDRPADGIWRSDLGHPPLTETEVGNAMAVLNNKDFIRKFPKLERRYADSPIQLQKIGLVSFIPAKGATPDASGIFGMMKLRGNYETPMEASERAEMIIRDSDSYHSIFHTHVGRPFPVTASSKWSQETNEVDINKAISSTMSADIKAKKKEEAKEVEKIKDREKALREDVARDEDDYETYITLKVKHAQLSFTFLEHHKKIAEVKGIILKTRDELAILESENPEFKNNYFEKYMAARREAGFKELSPEQTQENFMRFLVEDASLPDIDFIACEKCRNEATSEAASVEVVSEVVSEL